MEQLKKMKDDLIQFHQLANDSSAEFRLHLLKQMQTKEYGFKNREGIAARRDRFNKNKKLHRFFKRPCYVCGMKSEIRHHIISIKQGGTQSAKRNIVALCRPCHAEIHPWLKQTV